MANAQVKIGVLVLLSIATLMFAQSVVSQTGGEQPLPEGLISLPVGILLE